MKFSRSQLIYLIAGASLVVAFTLMNARGYRMLNMLGTKTTVHSGPSVQHK